MRDFARSIEPRSVESGAGVFTQPWGVTSPTNSQWRAVRRALLPFAHRARVAVMAVVRNSYI
jgi:hypothetical protein